MWEIVPTSQGNLSGRINKNSGDVGTDTGPLFGTRETAPTYMGPGPALAPGPDPCKGCGNRLPRPKQGSCIGSHITGVFLIRPQRFPWDVGTVSHIPTTLLYGLPHRNQTFLHALTKTIAEFY